MKYNELHVCFRVHTPPELYSEFQYVSCTPCRRLEITTKEVNNENVTNEKCFCTDYAQYQYKSCWNNVHYVHMSTFVRLSKSRNNTDASTTSTALTCTQTLLTTQKCTIITTSRITNQICTIHFTGRLSLTSRHELIPCIMNYRQKAKQFLSLRR